MKGIIAFLIVLFLAPTISSDALTLSARAAIVCEASTGAVLFEKNADDVLPMASTTKIMTALLVIERVSPDTLFTVSKKAASVEGSSIGLLEGERVSVSDLLYMLLLKSGNDAAITLAEGVSGSVEAFAAEMTERAAEIGCRATSFKNPHGLSEEGHHTTASDLARIMREALAKPLFAKIVATKEKRLDYKGLVLSNSNRLLTSCEGCIGGKTGFTKNAGRCLVSAARREGISVITVTLSAPDDWNDHKKAYSAAFERLSLVRAEKENSLFCRLSVKNGNEKEVLLFNTEPLLGIAVDGELIPYSLEFLTPEQLLPPIPPQSEAGCVALIQGGSVISSSPLASANRLSVLPDGEDGENFLQYLLKLAVGT